jgi:hypothetical protein
MFPHLNPHDLSPPAGPCHPRRHPPCHSNRQAGGADGAGAARMPGCVHW